jgi:tRNA G10  N-methylase Trm11
MATKGTGGDCPETHFVAKDYRHQLDLIVTDPPYGFNTNENKFKLGHLYQQMIRTFLSALTNHGQLVIAVPEWSHTGRQMPAFTYK